MKLLSITIAKGRDSYNNLIEKIINNYINQGIEMSVKRHGVGNYETIEFYIESEFAKNKKWISKEFINNFRQYSALAIADYIVDILEVELLDKIFQRNFSYIKADERKILIERALNFQENELYDKNIEVPFKVNKKAKILYKLMDLLNTGENINLEGFIRFRLKQYSLELKDLLDKIIEDYLAEKEYNEFIKLLKYFVNIQDSKIDLLNIVVDKKGQYHFYDGNNQAIKDSYIRDTMEDLLDTDLKGDDLLISSLITIAPKRLTIHQSMNIKNQEILETIKNIFDDRLFICNNCRICNLTKYIREE